MEEECTYCDLHDMEDCTICAGTHFKCLMCEEILEMEEMYKHTGVCMICAREDVR